jgi:hypothetical protein
MKPFIVSIAAIFILTASFAQDEVNYFEKKNELNVQLDDIFVKHDWFTTAAYLDADYPYYYYYDMFFIHNTSVGLGYKRHFEKGAFRAKISISTFSEKLENDKDDENDDERYGMHQESFSAGYEFHSNFGRTQIFFGLDGQLKLSFSSQEYKYREYNSGFVSHKYKSSVVSYGLKPFMGFKYFISPKFSVSTEYHILLESYNTKTKTEIEGQDTVERNPNKGFRTVFGPRGQLTFSFHF